jgi:mono/diheme cytochrome c family protein
VTSVGMNRTSMAGLLLVLLFLPLHAAGEDLPAQAHQILKKNCQSCHGALKMSGLDTRTREALLKGGEHGAAIKPGDPEASLLMDLVHHRQKPSMPPGKKLSDAELDVLHRWIAEGAAMGSAAPAEIDKKAELAKLEERPILPEERRYWAFQKPAAVQPPKGGDAQWSRNPVDAFLWQTWTKKNLRPSPRANARTLIRRAYLDLTGLPPAPEDVEAFVKDPSQQRWEQLIDKLLASPHYGERWGRHWLDLVRYADSGGFERDFDWHNAWRYRDYVVNAFNQDKPYDQFIRELIAGDEIAPESNEAVTATGYLRLGLDNNIKDDRTRLDELDDLVATTSLAFTGLTVGCARCHNHKFDPIPQKDYYRMQAVFHPTKGVEHPLVSKADVEAHDTEVKRIRDLQAPLKKQKKDLEEPFRKSLFDAKVAQLPEYLQIAWRTPKEQRTEGQRLNAEQIEKTLHVPEKEITAAMPEDLRARQQQVKQQIEGFEKQLPEPYPTARAIGEEGPEPAPSYFLHQGAPDAKGSVMQPGIITVAWEREYAFPKPPEGAKSSFRRRAFAEWLSSPENPLTARVMVNRIWQHHFGEGIVRTPSNFGKTGQPPSHPELLDYLANEFVRSGWSIKAMHRLMMTSRAYQMASDDVAENTAADPSNHLFWRMPRQRLQAEILRDQMMAVAGTLDRTVGGPAVFPYIDPDLFQSSTSRTWPGKPDDDPSTWRRSLYVFTKRSIRYPMFEAFDQPDAVNSCDRRNRSTIAPQALLLMNNSSVILQAQKFAERLEKETGTNAERQLERAFLLALSRAPRADEKERALNYLRGGQGTLADFCQLLFNLNEFAYRQ